MEVLGRLAEGKSNQRITEEVSAAGKKLVPDSQRGDTIDRRRLADGGAKILWPAACVSS